MNKNTERMQRAAAVAREFLERFADTPQGGFVVLWRMKPTGWTSALDDPKRWAPGALFVSSDGAQVFQATGGNADDGATGFWLTHSMESAPGAAVA